jgi:hypothetical protein
MLLYDLPRERNSLEDVVLEVSLALISVSCNDTLSIGLDDDDAATRCSTDVCIGSLTYQYSSNSFVQN